MFGYTTPSELPSTIAYTVRRPVCVVAIITPWNFPLAIPASPSSPSMGFAPGFHGTTPQY